MAVRIRMKRMGRRHRPFFRICVMDARAPRDGKVLEEVGVYDPMVPDTDARVVLNHERVSHWLSVGAQPTEKVAVLIKKYGPGGTRVEQNKAAREKLLMAKPVPPAPKPAVKPADEPETGDATAEETNASETSENAEAESSSANTEGEVSS